jgi:hypothetical protein
MDGTMAAEAAPRQARKKKRRRLTRETDRGKEKPDMLRRDVCFHYFILLHFRVSDKDIILAVSRPKQGLTKSIKKIISIFCSPSVRNFLLLIS